MGLCQLLLADAGVERGLSSVERAPLDRAIYDAYAGAGITVDRVRRCLPAQG